MPGHCIGRTVDSSTAVPSFSDSGAVAAGTTSRRATQSVSPGSPAKGLATNGMRGALSARPDFRRLLTTSRA